jgi:Bacteriophage T4, Recombination and repair protein, C-terminal domain
MNTELPKRLLKTSTVTDTALLSESRFFTEKDMIPTMVPMINVALSGKLTGGLVPGLTMWAGPSKHFKTLFSLLLVKAYMDKYSDSALLLYDSEFGSPIAYFDSLGIPGDRVIHTPVTDIEVLKHDIITQLSQIERGDHVIIAIDSIGNLASKKEIEDALAGKDKADFTRAKALKSLFRMVTPHLTIKDIPMVVVNHTYKEIAMHPRDIVGGGTGSYYSSDNIFIVGRHQDKDDKTNELKGYDFIINVEKSRYVKEKSKIPISVSFEGGISPWSGLLAVALDGGFVKKPKPGWYQKAVDTNEKLYREADTDCYDFWKSILNNPDFQNYITQKYSLSQNSILSDQQVKNIFQQDEVSA